MGGFITPDGYEVGTGPIRYDNNKYTKGGSDIIKVTVVDSRGNTSTSELKVNITGVYFQAYITSAKIIRENGVGKKAKLIAKGKISDYEISLFENPQITIKYTVDNKYTGIVKQEYITYNSDNTFNVNGYIEGDLGAEGFTQQKEFIVDLECSGQLNSNYPTFMTGVLVDKGEILYDITSNGVSFGGLYDPSEGGPLQFKGKDVSKIIITSNKEFETGRMIAGHKEFGRRIEYIMPSNANTWSELIQLDTDTIELTDFKLYFKGGKNFYPFPISYNSEEINIHYDSETKKINVIFNYNYPANKSGYGYIYYTKLKTE